MFCDEANLHIKAGNGGNGCVSMRREKFMPKGGPDGGDGGNGGNIILQSTYSVHTLSDYRNNRLWKAKHGGHGEGNDKHGKNGEDCILKVPVGTLIIDNETNEIIFDFHKKDLSFNISKGGRGGYGNAHFTSSVRQTPIFAEKGETIEEEHFKLELKLIADIAIIGFPSVGKSTLISVISNCKPKIAEYHFTTLSPNLGIVKVDDTDFVVADIPGLIEGASVGKGLGHKFLKHIERAELLLHLIDGTESNMIKRFTAINKELENYSSKLAKKEQIIIINKNDSFDKEYESLLKEEFTKHNKKLKIYFISSATLDGIKDILYVLKEQVKKQRKKSFKISEGESELKENPKRTILRPHLEKIDEEWYYQEINNEHHILGKRITQITNMTNFSNFQAVNRLHNVLEKKGILKLLKSKNWTIKDSIHIGKYEINFEKIMNNQ